MATKAEILKRALEAEAKLAKIARVRRPTAAESAEALAAYEAAREATNG